MYYRGAKAAILVFDLSLFDERVTMEELDKWASQFFNCCVRTLPSSLHRKCSYFVLQISIHTGWQRTIVRSGQQGRSGWWKQFERIWTGRKELVCVKRKGRELSRRQVGCIGGGAKDHYILLIGCLLHALSCKTGENVHELFQAIVDSIKEHVPKEPPNTTACVAYPKGQPPPQPPCSCWMYASLKKKQRDFFVWHLFQVHLSCNSLQSLLFCMCERERGFGLVWGRRGRIVRGNEGDERVSPCKAPKSRISLRR